MLVQISILFYSEIFKMFYPPVSQNSISCFIFLKNSKDNNSTYVALSVSVIKEIQGTLTFISK